MSKPLNVLFLFSDEHRRDALGCYDHPLVKTPNLDKLAERGIRFENAYTTSPICVPARASLATGEYVHKTRCWSNAQAYGGQPRSWGHQLQSQGINVESIGKLHYRGKQYNNGFDQEHLPVYIRNGTGWIKGLLRDHETVLDCSDYARQIGPGENTYTQFDLNITHQACDWLRSKAKNNRPDTSVQSPVKPWVLFVSWLRPHYPLVCPSEFYEMYPIGEMDRARFLLETPSAPHPVVQTLKNNFNYDAYFSDKTRQIARASYYGLCSFLDYQIGQVLDALESSGQLENTLIIYTSDHGDHNGDRHMWTKMSLFEESTGIPLIISGPGLEQGKSIATNASLVDIRPTILSAVGAQEDSQTRPGFALQKLASESCFDRPVLSEYHDGGSPTGMFMMKNSRWKYNYYPGYPPELYDFENDRDELIDLGQHQKYRQVVAQCHRHLRDLVDPEVVNQQAFDDQKKLISKLGGRDAILNSEEFDFTPVSDSHMQ